MDVPPVAELVDLLERVDGPGAVALARGTLAAAPVAVVVRDLLAPAQRQVGERWHAGRWTVAQEHAATAIIDDLLGLAAAAVPRGDRGRVALICAEGEWHVTPARMAALCWRDAGWDVTFLGGSTPPEHLRASLELRPPEVIALSCTIPLALPGAARVAAALRDLRIPVLAGGRAFGPDGRRADALGLHGWAATPDEASAIMTGWLDRVTEPPAPFVSDGEELSLEVRLPELVAAAERRLQERFPPMRAYDARQLARTREDLTFILRFVGVSLTVADPRVFEEFLTWLGELLEARGVPPAALVGSLACLRDEVADLPGTRSLLTFGMRSLEERA